jgi:hypothetical protein
MAIRLKYDAAGVVPPSNQATRKFGQGLVLQQRQNDQQDQQQGYNRYLDYKQGRDREYADAVDQMGLHAQNMLNSGEVPPELAQQIRGLMGAKTAALGSGFNETQQQQILRDYNAQLSMLTSQLPPPKPRLTPQQIADQNSVTQNGVPGQIDKDGRFIPSPQQPQQPQKPATMQDHYKANPGQLAKDKDAIRKQLVDDYNNGLRDKPPTDADIRAGLQSNWDFDQSVLGDAPAAVPGPLGKAPPAAATSPGPLGLAPPASSVPLAGMRSPLGAPPANPWEQVGLESQQPELHNGSSGRMLVSTQARPSADMMPVSTQSLGAVPRANPFPGAQQPVSAPTEADRLRSNVESMINQQDANSQPAAPSQPPPAEWDPRADQQAALGNEGFSSLPQAQQEEFRRRGGKRGMDEQKAYEYAQQNPMAGIPDSFKAKYEANFKSGRTTMTPKEAAAYYWGQKYDPATHDAALSAEAQQNLDDVKNLKKTGVADYSDFNDKTARKNARVEEDNARLAETLDHQRAGGGLKASNRQIANQQGILESEINRRDAGVLNAETAREQARQAAYNKEQDAIMDKHIAGKKARNPEARQTQKDLAALNSEFYAMNKSGARMTFKEFVQAKVDRDEISPEALAEIKKNYGDFTKNDAAMSENSVKFMQGQQMTSDRQAADRARRERRKYGTSPKAQVAAPPTPPLQMVPSQDAAVKAKHDADMKAIENPPPAASAKPADAAAPKPAAPTPGAAPSRNFAEGVTDPKEASTKYRHAQTEFDKLKPKAEALKKEMERLQPGSRGQTAESKAKYDELKKQHDKITKEMQDYQKGMSELKKVIDQPKQTSAPDFRGLADKEKDPGNKKVYQEAERLYNAADTPPEVKTLLAELARPGSSPSQKRDALRRLKELNFPLGILTEI